MSYVLRKVTDMPSELHQHWSRLLRARLEELGLNQSEAARLMGVTEATVSRGVNGVAPKDEKRAEVARALGMAPHELFPYEVEL